MSTYETPHCLISTHWDYTEENSSHGFLACVFLDRVETHPGVFGYLSTYQREDNTVLIDYRRYEEAKRLLEDLVGQEATKERAWGALSDMAVLPPVNIGDNRK